MTSRWLTFVVAMLALASCNKQAEVLGEAVEKSESLEAKSLLQGVWIDELSEDVSFRIEGDTVYYPDPTSLPTCFKVVGDSLVLGANRYLIVKQSAHVFWFKNQNGDVVQLVKATETDDALSFGNREPKVLSPSEVLKKDSVVNYDGDRYHWYIAVNPTRYRVTKTTYNDDGVGVENVYFDNIIHISLFKGATQLFSRDFNKQMYAADVPEQFLSQAVLGNIAYDHVDKDGFHFNATICIPDGASCYMVETLLSFSGDMSMRLLEY